jgi:hypothetical protein
MIFSHLPFKSNLGFTSFLVVACRETIDQIFSLKQKIQPVVMDIHGLDKLPSPSWSSSSLIETIVEKLTGLIYNI